MSKPTAHSETAQLSLATFNSHGVKGSETEIAALASNVNVLGICETWLRPSDLASQKQFTETASALPDHNGWRGQGGVAFILSPLLQYRVIKTYAQVDFQYVTLNITGTYVTVLYIRPNIPQSSFLQCLNEIQALTRGKSVVMGDLNARHKTWEKATNSHGRWLVEWATSNKWNIDAPAGPTFIGHQGTSTVDLFLTKGIHTSGASVLSGLWDGSSDHRAVGLRVLAPPRYTLDVPRIPQSQRRNPTYMQKAAELYSAQLPRFFEKVKSSSTPEALENVYSELTALILEPWAPARKHKPKRFKHFWTRRLDYLKSLRSKKYREAAAASDDSRAAIWEQYLALDRQLRSLLRKHKRQCRERLTDALSSPDPQERSKVIKAVLKSARASTHINEAAELDLASFTKSIGTPPGKGYIPPIAPIEYSSGLERKVYSAILSAKRNRATGSDELFNESFKLAPSTFAKVFSLLWVQCSQVRYLIQDWRTTLLVPIYKSGPKADPSSYRPIALLSHGRQMISKAIGSLIREEYTFHPTQLGFREKAGTETALLRHVASNADGFKYTAILDLKGAYPSVSRDKLMEKVNARLSPRTAAMVALELQPETVLTKGDSTGTTATVTLGVPQGGSSSPPLFNVEMDSFCEKLEPQAQPPDPADAVHVSVFADDVKLRSRTPRGLQKGLDLSTQWAIQEHMSWSPPKGHILEPEAPPNSNEGNSYYLSGQPIAVAKSAEYLGATLQGTMIGTTRNIARVKTALQRIGMLKAAGIHRKHVPSARLIQICRTYVYPLADYAVHLVPLDTSGACTLSSQLELLDYRVAEYAIGCIAKKPLQRANRRIGFRLPRVLKLAQLPDWLQRARLRLRSLRRRLTDRARLERQDSLAHSDPSRLVELRRRHKSPRDMSKQDVKSAWTALCRRLRRRIPVPESGLAPILSEPDSRVRDAGIRWFLGSFPGKPDVLRASFGSAEYKLHATRIATGLLMSVWPSRVRRETIASLGAFAICLEGRINTGVKRRFTSFAASPRSRKSRKLLP